MKIHPLATVPHDGEQGIHRSLPKVRGATCFGSLIARICLPGLLLASACLGSAQTVTLRSTDHGRVFQGLGALSAGASSRLLIDYPEPQRSQILDYLFKPGYGAALQHLKVEVGADVNSTDGAEPSHMRTPNDHDYTRGYEWWLMEEAKKRNPNIILDVLPWGAPGWVGQGRLYSADMANYMVDFIQGAQSAHHLHIDYVGAWNEREYDGQYLKDLAAALKRAHLDTKIVCCDAYPSMQGGAWAVVQGMQKDPELRDAVSVLGVHYPNEPNSPPTPQAALNSGKDLWASEDQPNPGGGPYLDRGWAMGGRILASQYISNYLDRRLTKTEIWSPITSYYDSLAAPHSGLMYANTPWSGHYDVQSTIWVTAQTSQFAQPGWQYLDDASGRTADGASYVSFMAPDHKAWSIVLETTKVHQPTTMRFAVEGSLATTAVHVWQTDATHSLQKIADIPVRNGSFEYKFQPDALYSLTSTTGQGRGSTTIPAPAPFPMPYRETMNSTPLHRSPRFLADQDGAFEAEPCQDRSGQCLVQQITQKPTPWSVLPEPFTLAGDANWRDYTLSADLRLPPYGMATLMGRIDSADNFQDGAATYPSAYVLEVHSDGRWQLVNAVFHHGNRVLASGVVAPPGEGWHHAQLKFAEDRITGELDGAPLFSLRDTTHTAGQIGIGSNWTRVAFDNLNVVPETF